MSHQATLTKTMNLTLIRIGQNRKERQMTHQAPDERGKNVLVPLGLKHLGVRVRVSVSVSVRVRLAF